MQYDKANMTKVLEWKSPGEGPCTVLMLEPFYGGSHKQLIDVLSSEVPGCHVIGLTDKKWHWRARTSALFLSQIVPRTHNYRVLFTSSVLNLAELVALRPDLAGMKKVLYFHENQLIYPVRKQQDRDFQYGYNQILSCLVADVIYFNSQYNMNSFLDSIQSFLKVMPDYRPKGLADQIRPKCNVLYFPIKFPQVSQNTTQTIISDSCAMEKNKSANSYVMPNPESECSSNIVSSEAVEKIADAEALCEPNRPLHIVWPHRWEHDKNPTLFFETLQSLSEQGLEFVVSVLGQTYTDIPDIFDEAKTQLDKHVLHWGFVETKQDYYKILCEADVVVSTADHEFFGVAMLEAVHCGCYPVAPKKLVYPEIFPDECLYSTPTQLLKKLKRMCQRPQSVRENKTKLDCHRFSWEALKGAYMKVFDEVS